MEKNDDILYISYFEPVFRMTGIFDHRLYITGQMKDGKKHGTWKFFKEDSETLLKEQEYSDGVLINETIYDGGKRLECIQEKKSEKQP